LFRPNPAEEVVSLIIHVIVYSKIYKYKRSKQPIGPLTFSAFEQQNFVANINSQSLTNFGINFVFIFTMISMFMAAKKTNELNPQDLGNYPNYFFVYFNLLAANGILGIFVHILFFYQNKDLRKAFVDTIKDIFLNVKETFVNSRH
jgi:hypothetical protein